MTPQELGPYLLLRKLSENALCETYRAGQRSVQEVERVVLLYFFNCSPDDALWLSETAQAGRRALIGLESPSLPAAIDSGEIDGTAYLTYDYIPGRSLDAVLRKVRRLESAVPIEHALLITDRIAQGLQAAWEHESRALHGFVVPHLVMLSNEGDVQLLGLEVASRLRKLLANERVREQMGRHLAPEVVPEGQPSTTDDVYSLGAILFELVTGLEPPADVDSLEEAIANARTADGDELPAPIVDLLEASLTAAFGRSDLKTWRSRLSVLLGSGEYDANAFNLALFLHALFGDEIESEAEEELGEGAMLGVTETQHTSSESVSPVGGDGLEVSAAEADETPDELEELPAALLGEETSQGPGKSRLLAIAAGVVLLAAVGFGAFRFLGPAAATTDVALRPTEPIPLSAPSTDQQLINILPGADVEAQAPPEQEAGLSPEEIDKRVQDLLSQRSADMESNLRRQFESELADLRRQLAEAQEQSPAAQVEDTEEPESDDLIDPLLDIQPEALRIASVSSIDEGVSTPSGEAADAGLAMEPDPQSLGGDGEPSIDDTPPTEERTGIETTDLLNLEPDRGDSEAGTDAPLGASPEAVREEVDEVTQTEPSPMTTARPTESEPAAIDTTPEVQVGDLVAPGPGVTPPRMATPAQPVYPILARRLKKNAVVTLRVLVDETGRVTEAERQGDEAGFGFDAAAMQAALKTRFEPATKDGVPVKIWWTVRMAFQP